MVDRLKSGDEVPLDAPLWNRLLELAAAGDPRLSGFNRGPHDTTDVVMVCKSAGPNFERFDVVKVDTAYTPDDAEAYKARKPVPTISTIDQDWIDACGTWGITLDPIRGDEDHVDECGRVLLLGTTQVLVDVLDTTHQWARPVDGQTYLESAEAGPARLLHHPDSTGSNWAVILLNHDAPRPVIFQAPEGGIGARVGIDLGLEECTVMTANGDNELMLTDETVIVYNWLSQEICANGDRLGVAVKLGFRWYAIADDCADESDTTFATVGE